MHIRSNPTCPAVIGPEYTISAPKPIVSENSKPPQFKPTQVERSKEWSQNELNLMKRQQSRNLYVIQDKESDGSLSKSQE